MPPASPAAGARGRPASARVDRVRQGAQAVDRGLLVAGMTATALIVAQAFVLFGESAVAEIAQIVVFGFLAVGYLVWRREPHRQMMLALALLPLIQLVSLSLPTRLIPTLEWFVIIGIPTYVLIVLAAYRLELRPYELGLRLTRWQPQARIVLVGAILGIPGYLILQPAPLVPDPTPLNVASAALIVALFGGFLEEGLFRGVIQSVAERSLARRSIAVSAFATGLLYSTSLDIRYVAYAVLVGILFGSIVRRTGSLVGVAGGHAALFAVQLVLLPALLG